MMRRIVNKKSKDLISSVAQQARRRSSKTTAGFTLADVLYNIERRLQAAQAALKNDLRTDQAALKNDLRTDQAASEIRLQTAQAASEIRLLAHQVSIKADFQSTLSNFLYKVLFVGFGAGFASFGFFEGTSRILGYECVKKQG